jgi:hypothetical protein
MRHLTRDVSTQLFDFGINLPPSSFNNILTSLTTRSTTNFATPSQSPISNSTGGSFQSGVYQLKWVDFGSFLRFDFSVFPLSQLGRISNVPNLNNYYISFAFSNDMIMVISLTFILFKFLI